MLLFQRFQNWTGHVDKRQVADFATGVAQTNCQLTQHGKQDLWEVLREISQLVVDYLYHFTLGSSPHLDIKFVFLVEHAYLAEKSPVFRQAGMI